MVGPDVSYIEHISISNAELEFKTNIPTGTPSNVESIRVGSYHFSNTWCSSTPYWWNWNRAVYAVAYMVFQFHL